MALVQTTLSADLSATDLTMRVASGTGFPAVGTSAVNGNFLVRVDGEFFWAIAQPIATVIKLRGRGSEGTVARKHDLLSNVIVGTPSEFQNLSDGWLNQLAPHIDVQETIGEDRVFTSAEIFAIRRNTTFVITKATPALITLVAPSVSQNGIRLTFTNQTAVQHVITATTLLNNGLTGSPFTTATFGVGIGGGITLMANNGTWNVVALPVAASVVLT